MLTSMEAVAGSRYQPRALRTGRLAYAAMKRILDLCVSALLLITTFPLWVAITAAIKLDSPGPVFFVQERVGLNGARFRCFKFRTMRVDAERVLEEMRRRGEVSGPVYKLRHDPRVTRVGGLLRRTSLDELPQLLNVLTGEMSLVGPRPCIPSHVEGFPSADRVLRLTAKPGLTCLWVVRGRSNCGFEAWMAADREYITQRSFWLDTLILIRTAFIVLTCRGAY